MAGLRDSESIEQLPISNGSTGEGEVQETRTPPAVRLEPVTSASAVQDVGSSTRPDSIISPRQRGYRKLASFMAEIDDVVIFRRFQRLNMVNLLRLQAELAALELRYDAACDRDDSSSNVEEQRFTQSFYELRESGSKFPGSQLDILDRIHDALNKYNTALLQVSQVRKLEQPDKYELERLQDWLKNMNQGALFLHKPEEEIWGNLNDPDARPNTSDQVTLAAREDHFSRGTVTALVSFYNFIWGQHREKTRRVDVERNQTYYPESNVISTAKVVTSVLASLFPGIVILALYLINTTIKRIGAMLCFTTFFAFVLSYWSLAKTIEVFAATAAFVAVEVVFIGSAITNGTAA